MTWSGEFAFFEAGVLFRGEAADNRLHRHATVQLTIGLGGPVALRVGSATTASMSGPGWLVRPEVAHALQLSRTAFVLKIGLPNALPDILAGMRLSITVSLIVAVVGEMIASQSGLGQAILLAARAFRANELFAGIVLLGLIGFLSNALLALAERRLLKWQAP